MEDIVYINLNIYLKNQSPAVRGKNWSILETFVVDFSSEKMTKSLFLLCGVTGTLDRVKKEYNSGVNFQFGRMGHCFIYLNDTLIQA